MAPPDVTTDPDVALSSPDFICNPISWDECASLSTQTISDVYLRTSDNIPLHTTRPSAWLNRTAHIAASRIHIPVGDDLRPASLAAVLRNPAAHGCSYAGLRPGSRLGDDELVHVRFQAAFIPQRDDGHGSVQFAPEIHSFTNTPALALLTTAQGLSVHKTSGRLLMHARAKDGQIGAFWLRTSFPTDAVAAAVSNGIAIDGVPLLGNVLAVVQVPLLRRRRQPRRHSREIPEKSSEKSPGKSPAKSAAKSPGKSPGRAKTRASGALGVDRNSRAIARRSASRLARGALHATYQSGGDYAPLRDSKATITVTFTFYYTIKGGVPSPTDVLSTVEELKKMYTACADLAPSGAATAAAATAAATAATTAAKSAAKAAERSGELAFALLSELERSAFPDESKALELRLMLSGAVECGAKRQRLVSKCQEMIEAVQFKVTSKVVLKLKELRQIMLDVFENKKALREARELVFAKMTQVERFPIPDKKLVLELKLLLAGAIDDEDSRRAVVRKCDQLLACADADGVGLKRRELRELMGEAFGGGRGDLSMHR